MKKLTTQQKLARLRTFSDEIVEAKELREKSPGYDSALNVQKLQKLRRELAATLPALRIVA